MRCIPILLLLVTSYFAKAQTPQPAAGKSWLPVNLDSIYRGTDYVQFEITTLDGVKLTNESFKGKVVLFDFWFEGCIGCRDEFGKLNDLYDSLRDDPECKFFAITFDPRESVPEFVEQFKLRYPIATVPDRAAAYRMNYNQGYPSKVLLDKKGRIAYIGMAHITERDMPLRTMLGKMRSLK